MNTKEKLFAVLNDVDKMNELIDKACMSQNDMIAAADRRDLLGKRMNQQQLTCPECDRPQLQLIGYIDIVPAQWKCRLCKHKFEWEGDDDS